MATGNTPLALCCELARMHLDWRQVTTFNLDEYVGLHHDHNQSCRHYMRENPFKHVNILPENVHIPDGLARDVPARCAQNEGQIRQAGGIDLQVLGIGMDRHIAFNEPLTANNPASALQMHPGAIVCLDKAAASSLERPDYYRRVYESKPEWQTY